MDAVLLAMPGVGPAVAQKLDGDAESSGGRASQDLRSRARALSQFDAAAVSTRSRHRGDDCSHRSAASDNNILTAFPSGARWAVLSVAMVPLSVNPASAMQYANACFLAAGRVAGGSSAIVRRWGGGGSLLGGVGGVFFFFFLFFLVTSWGGGGGVFVWGGGFFFFLGGGGVEVWGPKQATL